MAERSTPRSSRRPARGPAGRRLLALAGLALAACPDPQPPAVPCDLTEAGWAAVLGPGGVHSQARVWDELALHAIRKDLPQPTVHARNLFHLSAAMYDAWAAYDPLALGVFSTEKQLAQAADAARAQAVAFAGHRVLAKRYAASAGGKPVVACFDEGLRRAGFDPADTGTSGDGPAAVGNRFGQAVLDTAADDGANEAHGYADTSGWVPDNPTLVVDSPGTTMLVPDHWQQLDLSSPFTQNGIPQSGPQPFVGAHWGAVRPFAMTRSGVLYHDPGPAPSVASAELRDRWVLEVITKQSQLALDPAVTTDIAPSACGDNPLGSNAGQGRAQNPLTGQPYPPQVVPLADFGRVLAEFWADGPSSETPPGHWNLLAGQAADTPGFARRLGGAGDALPPLEWDVKVYLALNGALHDAAITAWEIKRATTTARPISLVRWLAGHDPRGLPLAPGVAEVRGGAVQVKSWHPSTGVIWADPALWVPYQKASFVTPAFPGFISGHSTFSRAAAEVLADLTGSPYFPGGLGEFVAAKNTFLSFESGPSVEVRLQWATWFDAADQAGQSRIWGGIHIEPDDFTGRKLGHQVGLDAVALARKHFAGTR